MTIAEHLELSDSVIAEKTSYGHFTVVHIGPSHRWVDTMMYGLDDNALYSGNIGYIHVFDDDRNINGNIVLNITAYGEGNLTIGGTEIQINAKEETYEVVIPFQRLISLKANNGTVQIINYTTQKQEDKAMPL